MNEKLILPSELMDKIPLIRRGKVLVTVNGSFDLLHAGHLYQLYEGKKQGDILLVALNSDSSIQQYKSADRPVIPLKYRLQMMAALEMVDYVTYFDETDPIAFLEKVRPDVHINGIEYGENCIEAEVIKRQGGRLHLVDRIDGLSTSNIIDKIKGLCV